MAGFVEPITNEVPPLDPLHQPAVNPADPVEKAFPQDAISLSEEALKMRSVDAMFGMALPSSNMVAEVGLPESVLSPADFPPRPTAFPQDAISLSEEALKMRTVDATFGMALPSSNMVAEVALPLSVVSPADFPLPPAIRHINGIG
jgi:hypothetical protein